MTQVTTNPRAIGLMCGAMLAFAMADTLIRFASLLPGGGASSGQIIALVGGTGAIAFALILLKTRTPVTRVLLTDRRVQLRTFSDLISIGFMVTALTMMPVSEVSAILQIQPILVTVAAVFLLKETVGPIRIAAIAVAFIGVLIILRPTGGGIAAPALLVLIAVFGMTARDLLSRIIGTDHSVAAMSFVVCAGMVPTGVFVGWVTGQEGVLTATSLIIIFFTGLLGVAGYYSITLATRIGEASVIAPFRYVRLPAAFLLAAIVLGERPDLWTIIGSVLVIIPGIVIWLRERRAYSKKIGSA